MTTQQIETLIIGAGQAGLSTGYQLSQLGREFLVVDGLDRIGDNWRRHYDSLTLFTPATANSLDGLPFPGDPWRFPTKNEMADYLELYAVTFGLPVRLQTVGDQLAAYEGGGFSATLDGQPITSAPAASAVRRALGEAGGPVHRSRLLPGAVEVLLAAGADDEATAHAEELAGIAESFGCAALRAAAQTASARVALARADADAALVSARLAIAEWASLSVTYEVASARLLVGRALRLIGDEESAAEELAEARKAFVELGCVPAAREAAALLGRAETPGSLSPREMEVLRLVAAGKSNPEIAAALVLSEKTVARHLSNIFVKLDVGSRTAAAAFAYAPAGLTHPSRPAVSS